MKDIQYNEQKKEDKKTNDGQRNPTEKNKYLATRLPLKAKVDSERYTLPALIGDTIKTPMISYEWKWDCDCEKISEKGNF